MIIADAYAALVGLVRNLVKLFLGETDLKDFLALSDEVEELKLSFRVLLRSRIFLRSHLIEGAEEVFKYSENGSVFFHIDFFLVGSFDNTFVWPSFPITLRFSLSSLFQSLIIRRQKARSRRSLQNLLFVL